MRQTESEQYFWTKAEEPQANEQSSPKLELVPNVWSDQTAQVDLLDPRNYPVNISDSFRRIDIGSRDDTFGENGPYGRKLRMQVPGRRFNSFHPSAHPPYARNPLNPVELTS